MKTVEELTKKVIAQMQERLDADLSLAMSLYDTSRITIQYKPDVSYIVAVDGQPFITMPKVTYITEKIE